MSYPHIAYTIYHTRAENTTFAFRSRERKCYFRPEYREKYFFCSTAPESGNFVSRSGREVGAFRPEGRKIVYRPWPVKQKASNHMFVNLGFASANNYMWSETFLILLALCRNILFCNTCTIFVVFRPKGGPTVTFFERIRIRSCPLL